MEELTDYTFPYKIGLIGTDDFNEKFLILLLTQNGYHIKHIVFGADKNTTNELNSFYCRYELSSAGVKNLNKILYDCDAIVINSQDEFSKYADINSLKMDANSKIPLIINQKLEIFVPYLNRFYSVFTDKQMLSFSGILSSLRNYHDYSAPFIPKVNIFEMFLKGIFIGIYVNLAIYKKLEYKEIIEVINTPFLNLIYIHFSVWKNLIKNCAEALDKSESIFPRDAYNLYKTKDGKYISFGNLEPKFQKSTKKIIKNMFAEDVKNKGIEWDWNSNLDEKFVYNYNNVSDMMSKHDRDEAYKRFANSETCCAPVLSIEEALQFQKDLNKSVILNSRLKDGNKLECLKQIENYLFKDLKSLVIIDLNAKVMIPSTAPQDSNSNRQPKF